MKSSVKPNKLACLPPGALAIMGWGKTLQSLGSVGVRDDKRTSIGKNLNNNPLTYYWNDPVKNIDHVPPGFDPTENNIPSSPDVEQMKDAQTN